MSLTAWTSASVFSAAAGGALEQADDAARSAMHPNRYRFFRISYPFVLEPLLGCRHWKIGVVYIFNCLIRSIRLLAIDGEVLALVRDDFAFGILCVYRHRHRVRALRIYQIAASGGLHLARHRFQGEIGVGQKLLQRGADGV